MRFSVRANALCISLMPLAAAFGATPTSVPTAAPPTATPVSAPADGPDAAAKHAKRTACLKEAKARKLVGPEKTRFVKDCLTGP